MKETKNENIQKAINGALDLRKEIVRLASRAKSEEVRRKAHKALAALDEALQFTEWAPRVEALAALAQMERKER